MKSKGSPFSTKSKRNEKKGERREKEREHQGHDCA